MWQIVRFYKRSEAIVGTRDTQEEAVKAAQWYRKTMGTKKILIRPI